MKNPTHTVELTVKIKPVPNDKARARARRNFVAKHNNLKGGYHTPAKYTRRMKYRTDWMVA